MSQPQPDDDCDDQPEDQPRYPQPPDSRITIERFPDGLTIQIPPAGLWRGTHGMFLMAVIWNGFMALLSPCLIAGAFGDQQNQQGNVGMLPLILALFWLVGIGLLLGAWNMGRRRAVLAVMSGSLMALQTGLFGSKQRDWAKGEVELVRTGPSGMEVNDRPVLELQIYDGGGRFSLLAGRSEEELQWLAFELRQALRVGG